MSQTSRFSFVFPSPRPARPGHRRYRAGRDRREESVHRHGGATDKEQSALMKDDQVAAGRPDGERVNVGGAFDSVEPHVEPAL
jgi:hypothetical protein